VASGLDLLGERNRDLPRDAAVAAVAADVEEAGVDAAINMEFCDGCTTNAPAEAEEDDEENGGVGDNGDADESVGADTAAREEAYAGPFVMDMDDSRESCDNEEDDGNGAILGLSLSICTTEGGCGAVVMEKEEDDPPLSPLTLGWNWCCWCG
jgi:hypothetical protein